MFVSESAAALFAQALSMESVKRTQFVTAQCGNDRELFDEVSSLLAAADKSLAYFDSVAGRVSLAAIAEDDEFLQSGKTVGQWRLLRCIGRGGMGAVFLAERADDAFEKQAAVKLLPFGMGSEDAIARFRQERQILARLVHENIARLLDGGVTDEGVPFFVMDYVDGVPIDVYCAREDLSNVERLRLVLEIANALQYAHSNLVVHRDLKPSNILVEHGGRIRLLDFGIATSIEPAMDSVVGTQFAQRPVTPAYASPEMLCGEVVDITTDVYSLGVLTYVLLTDHLPISYEGLSIAKSIERVRQVAPPPASFLAASVHADMDAVLSKALSKEPSDRYSSIDSFASDIRAFLSGHPVMAKPPTLGYRFIRFIRRNAAAVVGSLLATSALVATTGIALRQAESAREQRDAVLLEQQRVRASNEFLGALIDDLDTKPMTSLELLDKGSTLLLDQYDTDQPFVAYTLYELARRYARLNETDKQVELLERIVSLPDTNQHASIRAAAACRLSSALSVQDAALAKHYFFQGETAFSKLVEPDVETSVDCLRMLASKARRDGDIDAALGLLQQAKIAIDSAPAVSADVRGPLLGYMAAIHYGAGEYSESLGYLDQVLELLDSVGRGNSLGYLRVASNKAVTLDIVGQVEESLAIWDDIVRRIREAGYAQRGAASMLNQYGATLSRVGRNEAAAQAHQEARTVAERAGDVVNMVTSDKGMARVALANEDYTSALVYLDRLREYAEQDPQADPNLVVGGEVLRVKAYRRSGRLDLAAVHVERLLQESGYPTVEKAPHLLSSLIEATAVYQARGDFEHAEVLASDIIVRLSARAIGDPLQSVDVARAYVHRAEIRNALGDVGRARKDLSVGVPVLSEKLGAAHQEAVRAKLLLQTLTQSGSAT